MQIVSVDICGSTQTQVNEKDNRVRFKKKAPKGREPLGCIVGEADLLKKQHVCSYCYALKFLHETVNFCCSAGQVVLANNSLPDIIKEMITGKSEEAKQFRTCIRTYNNHLAFTSLGVTYDKELSQRTKGVYVFKAQGQMYHWLNDLKGNVDTPKNLEFYFYDTDYEIQNRIQSCPRLNENVLDKLLGVLQSNPYARFFRSLGQYSDVEEREIILFCNPQIDQRVYNKPVVSQVAAIFEIGKTHDKTVRSIQVYAHNGKSHCIQYYYGCYDPLQYPLLFPYGDLGWHQGIKKQKDIANVRKRKRNVANMLDPSSIQSVKELLSHGQQALDPAKDDPDNISIREYYAYKFQIRDKDESCLLNFGRIFQEFSVDMFVKMETQRLDYYRSQQTDIRTEFVQGLADAMASGEKQCGEVGQRVVLRCFLCWRPRHMKRKYLYAMTLVRKFGKPDLFITMTSNPNWAEVKEQFLPGEEAQNRPDLIVRVFHSKLEELKDEMFKRNIFGEVAAYTYVIEF